jgi:hypothetical protein
MFHWIDRDFGLVALGIILGIILASLLRGFK